MNARRGSRKTKAVKKTHDAPRPPSVSDPEVARLFRLTKKHPQSFRELCDKMNVAPKVLEAIVRRANKAGVAVAVEHDYVGTKLNRAGFEPFNVGIDPVVGQRQRVGVISDTHLGSKYCLRSQMRDFIEYAYEERGVREILHPGDLLEGDYRHAKFELSHVGVEDQVTDLFQTLPQKKGLTYHAISGNHDFTFTYHSGIDITDYVEQFFAQNGRDDFFGYGDRSAFLDIRGARVHLWHPSGSLSYARSYKLQKQIEKYAPGEKPQILLTGHFLQYCHINERGIHAILCPTFQGGGSAFGKSIGGSPAIGGLILEWTVTKNGTMRDFAVEFRQYYERETTFRMEQRDGRLVPHAPTRKSWARELKVGAGF
jgi:predicted phosphodiesterase